MSGERRSVDCPKVNVLVYEENHNIKMFMTTILQKVGFTVYFANTPYDINVYVQNKNFDLIIISISFRNYFSVINSIRKNEANAIMFLTGTIGGKEEASELKKIGVDEILPKPFSEEILYNVIKKYNLVGKGEDINNLQDMRTQYL